MSDDEQAVRSPVGFLRVRADESYRNWMAEFAYKTGRTNAGLIDLGLRELAQKEGFRPPPRRVAGFGSMPE